jgi:two-component system sensor histidine kinase AlgZ
MRAIAVSPESRAERLALFSGLLPRELFWFYLLCPPLVAFMFDPDAAHWSWESGGRAIVGSLLPFIAIPAAMHSLYRWVMPGWLASMRSDTGRFFAHLGVASLGSAAVGLLIIPLVGAVKPEMVTPAAKFAFICALVGTALCLPAVIFTYGRRCRQLGIRRFEAMGRAALEAKLQALQARTNPHFLFNAINTVASLIPSDPELAEDTLTRLADLLRYTLDSSQHQTVPLAAEIEIARDYLEIQSRRFGERMRWSLEIDPGVDPDRQAMPPLSLQPLVENAVLHGVGGGGGEPTAIEISIAPSDGGIECVVRDHGPGGGSGHVGSGTSTRDLRERLRLLYRRGDLLRMGPAEGGGWISTLVIPEEPAE